MNKCFVYPSDEHNNLFATVDTVKPVKNVHSQGVAVLQNWGQQRQIKMTAKHKIDCNVLRTFELKLATLISTSSVTYYYRSDAPQCRIYLLN